MSDERLRVYERLSPGKYRLYSERGFREAYTTYWKIGSLEHDYLNKPIMYPADVDFHLNGDDKFTYPLDLIIDTSIKDMTLKHMRGLFLEELSLKRNKELVNNTILHETKDGVLYFNVILKVEHTDGKVRSMCTIRENDVLLSYEKLSFDFDNLEMNIDEFCNFWWEETAIVYKGEILE